MRIFRLILAWLFCMVLAACATPPVVSHLDETVTHAERRLLVTFADQSLNRPWQGNPQDDYPLANSYRNSGWSERKAKTLADQYHLRLIAQWPVTELGVSCVLYEAPENLPLPKLLDTLRQDQSLASVQPMQMFDVLNQPPALNLDPYQSLQTGYQALGIANWHRNTTGRGVRIAVIDTGVDLEHPDLKGQIQTLENMAPEPADHNLADVHGTAVVGILAARPNNGIGIAGIAPDAEIFALRACWPTQAGGLAAKCNSFTLALALNRALARHCQIINLSLSGPDDPLLRQLLEKALAKGVLIIAASSQNLAGGFPASLPGVLAVGTNDGKTLGLTAPGTDILTTVPHQAYDFMTGSSFAAPHVAGLAALLWQLHPQWPATEIVQTLRGAAASLQGAATPALAATWSETH